MKLITDEGYISFTTGKFTGLNSYFSISADNSLVKRLRHPTEHIQYYEEVILYKGKPITILRDLVQEVKDGEYRREQANKYEQDRLEYIRQCEEFTRTHPEEKILKTGKSGRIYWEISTNYKDGPNAYSKIKFTNKDSDVEWVQQINCEEYVPGLLDMYREMIYVSTW